MTLFSYLTKIRFLRGNFDYLSDVDKYRICLLLLETKGFQMSNGVFGEDIFIKELNTEYFVFIRNPKYQNSYYACLVNEINVATLKFEFLNIKGLELYKEFIKIENNNLYVSFKPKGCDNSIMPAPIEKTYKFDLTQLKDILNYYEGWEIVNEEDI